MQQELRLNVAAGIVEVEGGEVVEADGLRRRCEHRVACGAVVVDKRDAEGLDERPAAAGWVDL